MIPINDFVVVSQYKEPEKTKGGVILSNQTTKATHFGLVKFAGPECKTVQAGHIVVMGGNLFTTYKLGNEEYYVIKETDIPGVLEREEINTLGLLLNNQELM